jgi:hypothetical protein
MCLNETYSNVHTCKCLPDAFPIRSSLKYVDALSPLVFNFDLEYDTRKVKENQEEPELNGTHHILVYADSVNILRKKVNTVKENTETLRTVRRLV